MRELEFGGNLFKLKTPTESSTTKAETIKSNQDDPETNQKTAKQNSGQCPNSEPGKLSISI